MRLSLTLVDGRTGRPVDALVDLDSAAPLGDVVPALVGALGEDVHESFARRIPVWVDGVETDPQLSAGTAGLRNGAVVALFEAEALAVAADARRSSTRRVASASTSRRCSSYVTARAMS